MVIIMRGRYKDVSGAIPDLKTCIVKVENTSTSKTK